MVRSTACPMVLRPLPDSVVLPTLHSPVAVSLPFLFFLMYCLTCFCFLHQFYYGLQDTCSYKAFRHDEARGFLLACSRLGIDTVVSIAWYLGALSLPYSSSIDIVWRGPAFLVLGILWLSGSDVVSHCGIAIVCLGSVMAVLCICLPPYLVWHFTG